MIKNLKQIFLAIMFAAVVSVSASAQKDGEKKPPPKPPPPVIIVTPKEKPKEDKPKEDKKPQAMIFNEEYEVT
ncbi:MAG: hypothetical protein LH614_01015 [Pyrinomonadaceae bacterium]|nr:hypothetical protein [Pyrinomonadaceae bacterium]